jgi:hypothetical protein
LHSSKAKKIKQEGNRRLDVAQGWFNGALESLMKIIRQIGDLGGFPTPEDFKRAAERAGKRDCADLERLFARANTIGPGNSILSTGEFKFAAGRVSQGDLEPLRRLLRFTDLLGLRNYPASQDYENAVAKANDGDRQPLDGLLAQIDSGLAVQTVFKTAKDQAAQENFEQLKGFLHYSAQIHASRKKGEQDRLQIYSRVLEQCSAQKPSLFDWIRDLFGW